MFQRSSKSKTSDSARLASQPIAKEFKEAKQIKQIKKAKQIKQAKQI